MGFCTLLQNEYFTLFYNKENIVAVVTATFCLLLYVSSSLVCLYSFL